MKFRKKPVVIEAVQYDGTSASIAGFVPAHLYVKYSGSEVLEVLTLEGPLVAQVGDWIIKGIRGEFYPIKDGIFRETYEAVDDAAR